MFANVATLCDGGCMLPVRGSVRASLLGELRLAIALALRTGPLAAACVPVLACAFSLLYACLLLMRTSCAQAKSPLNPKPFLASLAGREVIVKLKWGTEYRGTLISVDDYMNFQVSTRGAERARVLPSSTELHDLRGFCCWAAGADVCLLGGCARACLGRHASLETRLRLCKAR